MEGLWSILPALSGAACTDGQNAHRLWLSAARLYRRRAARRCIRHASAANAIFVWNAAALALARQNGGETSSDEVAFRSRRQRRTGSYGSYAEESTAGVFGESAKDDRIVAAEDWPNSVGRLLRRELVFCRSR